MLSQQSLLNVGESNAKCQRHMTKHLAFSDDTAVIALRKVDLEEAYVVYLVAARKMGLVVNAGKTKYIQPLRREDKWQDEVMIRGDEFGKVKIIGLFSNSYNEVTKDIKARVVTRNKNFRFRCICRKKLPLHESVIRPTDMNGLKILA